MISTPGYFEILELMLHSFPCDESYNHFHFLTFFANSMKNDIDSGFFIEPGL